LGEGQRVWATNCAEPKKRDQRGVSLGVTLDAGPLIHLDHANHRVIVLLARAQQTGERVIVPATALAQAIRDPSRQARLARLLRQPRTDVVALDRVDATAVGRLLAASGSSDIADANVVHAIQLDPLGPGRRRRLRICLRHSHWESIPTPAVEGRLERTMRVLDPQ